MKKIGLIVKEASGNRIKTSLQEAVAVFIIKYPGLSSPDMSALRLALRAAKASFFVVKNSVARRVLKETSRDSLLKNIDGQCGFIFVKEEPVAVSKALWEFFKTHEKLKIEGGILADRILESKDIEAMSRLPSRGELRAQVVCALNAPIANLVMTLNQLTVNLVMCLDQIRQKKTG